MPVPTDSRAQQLSEPLQSYDHDRLRSLQDGTVRLIIYDVMGREVTRLVNGFTLLDTTTYAGTRVTRWANSLCRCVLLPSSVWSVCEDAEDGIVEVS